MNELRQMDRGALVGKFFDLIAKKLHFSQQQNRLNSTFFPLFDAIIKLTPRINVLPTPHYIDAVTKLQFDGKWKMMVNAFQIAFSQSLHTAVQVSFIKINAPCAICIRSTQQQNGNNAQQRKASNRIDPMPIRAANTRKMIRLKFPCIYMNHQQQCDDPDADAEKPHADRNIK